MNIPQRSFTVEHRKRRFNPRTEAERHFKPASPTDHAVTALIATAANDDTPYEWVKTEIMPTDVWMRIRDNPRQRDVKARVAKGRASHLMKFDESHRKVTIGSLPDGRQFKVDGHTRCFVWQSGMAVPPQSVIVETWLCNDIEAVQSLYDKCDNNVASETGSDRVTGASRSLDMTFESSMLHWGEVSTAVRILWQFLEKRKIKRGEKDQVITKAVRLFSNELAALDKCSPTRKKFPQCVVAAALLSLRADRDDAEHFWTNYAKGLGEKSGGLRDAVAVFEDRLPAILKKGNGTKEMETMREAVAAIQAYKAGKVYTNSRGYTSIDSIKLRAYAAKAFGGAN